jgi:hypothetical protein
MGTQMCKGADNSGPEVSLGKEELNNFMNYIDNIAMEEL